MNARTFILSLGSLCIGGSLLAVPNAGAQGLSERIDHVMRSRDAAPSKGRLLGVLLYTDLSLTFTETPAREVIEYLQTVLGVPIIGRYSDDRTGLGIDPEAEISLEVVSTPALTVLEMVLAQASDDYSEPTWQLRRGFVEVGTKERLGTKSAQEIRYYPIRDLMFEAPQFDNAPELDLDAALSQNKGGGGGGSGGFGGGGAGGGGGGNIISEPGAEPERAKEEEMIAQIVTLIQETVEPDGWVENGGEWATIRAYQGTLIIRAPDFIHRQIGGYPVAIPPSVGPRDGAPRRRATFTGEGSQIVDVVWQAKAADGGAGGSGDGGVGGAGGDGDGEAGGRGGAGGAGAGGVGGAGGEPGADGADGEDAHGRRGADGADGARE